MAICVQASDVAIYLGEQLIGEDFEIYKVAPLGSNQKHTMCFVKGDAITFVPENKVLYLVTKTREVGLVSKESYIKVDNPRLAFAKVMQKFYIEKERRDVSATCVLKRNVKIGVDVSIGEYTVVGVGVEIGSGTRIGNHVVIAEHTVIGNNCIIKSHTTIGEDGFGFEYEEGVPIRVPHIGRVVIDDGVEVGANVTISKGTLGDTHIRSSVKLSDQVHIAHNCTIGENTLITGGVVIGGGTVLGKNCWIGPQAVTKQKIKVGDYAKIGIGAVVVSNVPEYGTVMGLEAISLRNLVENKKKIGW